MRSLPTHRNRYTGEILANAVEVCPACHRNFASTRAGDKHRVTIEGKRVCISPIESGLEPFTNKHGATIYRVPVRTCLEPTQSPHIAVFPIVEGYSLTA